MDHFAEIADPRQSLWVVHPVAAVLALCAAAVVAGMRSFTAIAGWVADVSAEQLAGRLGETHVPRALLVKGEVGFHSCRFFFY